MSLTELGIFYLKGQVHPLWATSSVLHPSIQTETSILTGVVSSLQELQGVFRSFKFTEFLLAMPWRISHTRSNRWFTLPFGIRCVSSDLISYFNFFFPCNLSHSSVYDHRLYGSPRELQFGCREFGMICKNLLQFSISFCLWWNGIWCIEENESIIEEFQRFWSFWSFWRFEYIFDLIWLLCPLSSIVVWISCRTRFRRFSSLCGLKLRNVSWLSLQTLVQIFSWFCFAQKSNAPFYGI